MDRNNTNGKPGSKLSSQDLARYQAELMWMHDKTIREIKEAKEKDAREAELRAKRQQAQQ